MSEKDSSRLSLASSSLIGRNTFCDARLSFGRGSVRMSITSGLLNTAPAARRRLLATALATEMLPRRLAALGPTRFCTALVSRLTPRRRFRPAASCAAGTSFSSAGCSSCGWDVSCCCTGFGEDFSWEGESSFPS